MSKPDLHVDPSQLPKDATHTNNGWHTHTCKHCGYKWAHDGQQLESIDLTSFLKAHTCPACDKSHSGWCDDPDGKSRESAAKEDPVDRFFDLLMEMLTEDLQKAA